MCNGCLCKKGGLGQEWRSDIAVSGNLAKHSNIQSENTRFDIFLIHTYDEILHSHSR